MHIWKPRVSGDSVAYKNLDEVSQYETAAFLIEILLKYINIFAA